MSMGESLTLMFNHLSNLLLGYNKSSTCYLKKLLCNIELFIFPICLIRVYMNISCLSYVPENVYNYILYMTDYLSFKYTYFVQINCVLCNMLIFQYW